MSILEKLEQGINLNSIEDTFTCAAELAAAFPENSTLAFHGDLGAGKTTFVKGLAKAWEIQERVTSPTYNFFTTYKGTRNLLHLDAYRLDRTSTELSESLFLLDDYLVTPYCLAVEWPEKLGDELPKDAWHLHIKIVGENQHYIKLTRP